MFLTLFAFGQGMLGQTKTYIINQMSSFRIVENWDNALLIESVGGSQQLFLFNPANNNLCDIWATEVTKTGDMLPMFLEGTTFIQRYERYLLPTPCKNGNPYPPANLYSKGEHIYVEVYESDLCGTLGDKWTVVIETWPHKN